MFNEIKPKSGILRKYIMTYNVLREQSQFPANYFAFPHTYNIVTFFNNTAIEISENELTLSGNSGQSSQVVILGRYLWPLKIKYQNFVDEISINFKPLSVNHFFDMPFSSLAPHYIQKIENPEWTTISKKLFETDTHQKIEMLEGFLISKLREKPLQQLKDVIDAMDKDETIEVHELARQTNQTERTLSRNFRQYAGCTPSAYKRILRFRKSIDLKYLNDKNLNCTDICFSNSFYDTAHFRKEFRRLTGQTPKEFFDTLSLVGEGQYPFKLV